MVLTSDAGDLSAHDSVTNDVAMSSTDCRSSHSDDSSHDRSKFSRLWRCFGGSNAPDVNVRLRKYCVRICVVAAVRDGSSLDCDSSRQTMSESESSVSEDEDSTFGFETSLDETF